MYISFYITDSRNGLIFQYLPSADAPSFTNLWTRIKSTCPQLTKTQSDDLLYRNSNNNSNNDGDNNDYTIYSPTNKSATHGLVGKDLEVFKYYSRVNNIYYWSLRSLNSDSVASQELNIEPHVIMAEIDQMLLDYFDKDKMTIKKIVNNYDQITLIFNCCINGGEPMTGGMYMNRVKNIVPMKSDFSKVINSTAYTIQNVVARHQYPINGLMENTEDRMFRSNSKQLNRLNTGVEVVPWRSNKSLNNSNRTSYNNNSGSSNSNIGTSNFANNDNRNELYLDIKETMCLVMERSMNKKRRSRNSGQFKIVNGRITGIFDCRSYLIGEAPFVTIDLNNHGYDLGFPSLHRCVELDQFDSQNTNISFIPPNGKFRLMEYNLDIQKERYGIISLDYSNNLGIEEDEFEVTINIGSSRRISEIHDLCIELQFKANDNTTNMYEEAYPIKTRILRSTHGRFSQIVNQNRGIWEFDSKISTGTIAILRGCIENQNKEDTDKNRNNNSNNDDDDDDGNDSSISNCKKVKKIKSKYTLNRVILRYKHEGESLSGITVNSIKVENQLSSSNGIHSNNKIPTPFKGVKYLSYVKNIEMRTC